MAAIAIDRSIDSMTRNDLNEVSIVNRGFQVPVVFHLYLVLPTAAFRACILSFQFVYTLKHWGLPHQEIHIFWRQNFSGIRNYVPVFKITIVVRLLYFMHHLFVNMPYVLYSVVCEATLNLDYL